MSNNTSHINNQEYSVNIGQYFSRGWEIFAQYPLGFIGFPGVVSIILTTFNKIPDPLGSIINLILTPVLWAGFSIVALLIAKKRPFDFSDFFRGFNQFLQIFLVDLVRNILVGICLLPIFLFFYFFFYLNAADLSSSANNITFVIGILLVLSGVFLSIYLSIAYQFSSLFVIEKKLSFWSALEASRKLISQKWFSFLLLNLLFSLVCIIPLLITFGLGAVVITPLGECIMVAAFEDIVGLNGV